MKPHQLTRAQLEELLLACCKVMAPVAAVADPVTALGSLGVDDMRISTRTGITLTLGECRAVRKLRQEILEIL